MHTGDTPTRMKVFEALFSREGSFVSGEALSEGLGLSRTAVWKAITALRTSGCVIESAGGRGYRLLEGGRDLTPETVAVCLRGTLARLLGGACPPPPLFLNEIGSTNDEAKNLARNGAPHGSVVVADCQTAGRGRLGRTWFSPPGTGLWVSVILRPANMALGDAPKLTGMAAVAVSDAVSEATGVTPQVKWPNDLLLSGRKICGILVEVGAEVDAVSWAVVGVGLNVNTPAADFPVGIGAGCTSLAIETGLPCDRLALLGRVVANIVRGCAQLGAGQWPTLRDRLENLSCIMGQEVLLSAPDGGRKVGRAHGLDDDGALLIVGNDGRFTRVIAGDISLRLQNLACDDSGIDKPTNPE